MPEVKLTKWCLTKTVLILKYMIPGYNEYAYYGGANVGMNGGFMLRYVFRSYRSTGSDTTGHAARSYSGSPRVLPMNTDMS
jgi:hypothetical protein